MAFIQSVQIKSKNFDQIKKISDEWRAQTAGQRTATRATICKDRDNADTYYVLVEFPSYDAAMKNSQMPQTDEFSKQIADLADEVKFFNLDVIQVDEG